MKKVSIGLLGAALLTPAFAQSPRDDSWVWRPLSQVTSTQSSAPLSPFLSNQDQRFSEAARRALANTSASLAAQHAVPASTAPAAASFSQQPLINEPPAAVTPATTAAPAATPAHDPAAQLVLAPVSPIPEPSTTALLLGGLGAIGLLYARRSKKK